MVGRVTSLSSSATPRWPTMPANVDAAAQFRSVRLRVGSFDLDPKSGELLGKKTNTLLQWQPLQLLLMLIDAGGELVTRAQIQQRLWGNDVIVDYEHSINTLVRKLRRVLGDSADTPTYIETLARRGYRLKVPVEMIEEPRANSEPRSGLMLSLTTLPAVCGEDERATSGQSLAMRVQHITGPTERGFVAPRAFRCRGRASYNWQRRRDNFAPPMVGMVSAQRLCESLISAPPADRLATLQQVLALVAHVLEVYRV